MKRWLAILALGLMACSQTPGVPVAKATPAVSTSESESPTASPSEMASPSASVSPAVTPSPDLPLMPVGFSCRLPVLRSDYPNFNGGFITFPAGTFALDAQGGITSDSDGAFLSTDTSPVLNGTQPTTGQPFYDAALHRWLPAGAGQSTPDGSRYAYEFWDASQPNLAVVHVVNVATATDRAYNVTMPFAAMGFTVADFDSNGVYLLGNAFEQLPEGVWLMNTSTGALQRVVTVGHVAAVSGGYAWVETIDPRDPSPPQLRRSGTPSDSIVRVDLSTGAQTVWYYRAGKQVDLMGFGSAGHPVVHVYDPNGTSNYSETWLAGDPSQPTLIYAGSLSFVAPQSDGARIWFSGMTNTIYLYTAATGLRKVAAVARLAPNESVTAVGFCS